MIVDWDDSIIDLWEAIDDNRSILKVERMYKKNFDKTTKKFTEEETDNIVVTFKGGKIKTEIWLWNRKLTIKVRPYIMPVKQCFKCFRYGHLKVLCKSEEICIICGDKAHGRCDKEAKCRNCGGQHRSTNRKCPVYEKNKSIQVIMAYHNISYGSAIRVLEGKEDEPARHYDRFEEPERWPKLPSRRNKSLPIEPSQTQRIDEIISQDNRKMLGRGAYKKTYNKKDQTVKLISKENPWNREKDSDNKEYKDKKYERRNLQQKRDINSNVHNYWKQFNARENDISKEKYGIAFSTPTPISRTAGANSLTYEEETEEEEIVNKPTERSNSTGTYYPDETLKKFITKIKSYLEEDWEFRRILSTMLEGPRKTKPEELNIYSSEDEEIRKNIIRRRRELHEEEQSKKQRLIAQETKRKFWQDRKEKSIY